MTTKRLIEQFRGARGPELTPVKPDDSDREARILAHAQRVQAELARLESGRGPGRGPGKACRACDQIFRGDNGAARCWRCRRDRVYSKAV